MSEEIPGDIPVTGTKVDAGSGGETFTIQSSGPNHRIMRVKTQNKRLQITVNSGGASVTLPLEKDDWSMRIEEVKN